MILKVYVDVLFLTNFMIDYCLLSITGFFLKKRLVLWRIGLSSVFGAVYASLLFFMPFGAMLSVPMALVSACFMTLFAFGGKDIKRIIKNTSAYLLISLVLGGAGFYALFLCSRHGLVRFTANAGIVYADINAYTLFIAFFAAVILLHTTFGYIQKQRIKSRYLYTVTLEKNGKTITDTALFDTGNFLRHPIMQSSVVIAEWQIVKDLFSEKTLSQCVAAFPKEFTYIPCRTAFGTGGLFAFRPDRVFSDELALGKNIYIGISEQVLDKDGSYRMILPNDASFKNNIERI